MMVNIPIELEIVTVTDRKTNTGKITIELIDCSLAFLHRNHDYEAQGTLPLNDRLVRQRL